ncbi:MAG: hypothetical protein AB8E82_10995 [Aureispira sp.]
MKYTILITLFAILLGSCGAGNNNRTPEKTCEDFIAKLANKEYAAAKKYTSGATDPYLDFLTQGAEIFNQMSQEGNNFQALVQVENASKLSYNCTITGDDALCNCTHQDDKAMAFSLSLIRENGQWVIHQPKETTAE